MQSMLCYDWPMNQAFFQDRKTLKVRLIQTLHSKIMYPYVLPINFLTISTQIITISIVFPTTYCYKYSREKFWPFTLFILELKRSPRVDPQIKSLSVCKHSKISRNVKYKCEKRENLGKKSWNKLRSVEISSFRWFRWFR